MGSPTQAERQRQEDRAEDRQDRADDRETLATLAGKVEIIDKRLGRIEVQLSVVLSVIRWLGFGGVAALLVALALVGLRAFGVEVDLP